MKELRTNPPLKFDDGKPPKGEIEMLEVTENHVGIAPLADVKPENHFSADGIYATELRFTETYKKYANAHPAIREAMCLKAEYPAYFTGIQGNDLIAGRIKHGRVGFSIDEWGPTAFGYYCQEEEILKDLEAGLVPLELRDAVMEMVSFWRHEDTSSKLRARYPEQMKKYLPSDDWMGSPGIAFPLYRLTGANVNFKELMELGIPGLRLKVANARTKAAMEGGDEALFEAMEMAIDVLVDVCMFYKNDAERKAEAIRDSDPNRSADLLRMANTLEAITVAKPKTLREAIQLFWLYSLVGDIRNYGRMDVYLGDFYVNDLQSGALDYDEALKLLQSLWQLMADRNTRVHGRVIIGGKGRPNVENADEFALLAMEATRTVKEIEPQLSLRIYDGMDHRLLDKALEVIGEGRTFPILYNDEVNIPAIAKGLNVSIEEAEQYVPFGCGEYIIDHRSFGTPSGVINLLKALEVTIHNGIDPLTGKVAGLALGELKDFNSFDDLWSAYTRQVEFFVDLMAQQEELEYKVAAESAAFLFVSMLYDDCIERGKAIFSGGVHYLGGTLETYGNTNTADSLTAIKQLVYDTKTVTPDELITALDSNFVGYTKLRKQLQRCPKYGNDNEIADQMLLNVHNHVCKYTRDQKNKTTLHSYSVVIINNSANTLMGRHTAASADGRLSGTSMNNGNAPSSGNDIEGLTAMLNSIVKPDPSIHAGAVQNMKFSKELFTDKREELKALLQTYMEKGGTQAMITVVSRDDLENAMKDPEHYRHIFVRVGGFSARFVELDYDIQLEILNRTLY